MRNRIFGAIGVVWGGAIMARWFMSGSSGDSAYHAGQNGAVIFGVLLLVAGIYYFFKKPPAE